MGNQTSSTSISGKKGKKQRAAAKLSVSLNGRYTSKKHQHEDGQHHLQQHQQQQQQLQHQHQQQQFSDSAESESRDFDDCGATSDSRPTASCLSAQPSDCTARSSCEYSSAPSCSCCSSFTVLSGDGIDLSGRDRETLVEDHVTLAPENDECWLTQNISFQPSVADLSDSRHVRQNRDNNSSNLQPQMQGASSYSQQQSYEYAQPLSHRRQQFFDNELHHHHQQQQQQLQQQHESVRIEVPPAMTGQGMVQQFSVIPGGDTSGAMGNLSHAFCETSIPPPLQQQQQQQLVQSQPPQTPFPNAASAVGGGKSFAAKSVTSPEEPPTPQCISRTVFVPQNWTSVIFFVKGSEAEAIARSCHADLTISCLSVNCSKREKDVLGTAKKRAVHIRAASVEDAASTVEQLLAVMPVLVSHPDLPERSCLIREADGAGAAGDSSVSACLPEQGSLSRSPPEATIRSPSSRQPAGNLATTASSSSAAAAAAAAAVAAPNSPAPVDPQSQTQGGGGGGGQADSRTFCSRRQLNERPAVLEVDVENTSAGLLPFFPGSSDRRGSVVAARSGCTIEITDKVRRKPAGEERRILRVQGPSVSALEKCVRLLELYFPSMGARGQFRELRERLDFGAKQLRFS